MSLLCKIREAVDKFTFKADSASLEKMITKMINVTGFVSTNSVDRNHMFAAFKGELFLIGYGSDTFVALRIPDAEPSGNGSFNFDPEALKGLIKRRGDLEFSYTGSEVEIKTVKGKYSAKLRTDQISVDQVPAVNEKFAAKTAGDAISNEVLDAIKAGVRLTSIKDPYMEGNLNCYIKISGKTLTVSNFCDWALAHYEMPLRVKHSPVSFAMPVKTYDLANKFIEEEDEECTISMADKYFRVDGDNFIIVLPPVQVTEDDFVRVPTYLNSIEDGAVKFLAGENIHTVMDNIVSMKTKDTSTGLSIEVIKKGGVRVTYKSDKGEVQDAFRVKNIQMKEPKFLSQLDLSIFTDLLANLKGQPSIPFSFHVKDDAPYCFTIPTEVDGASLTLLGYVPG